MSFSAEVKEELSREVPPARHCKIAEIAAIISMCGKVIFDENDHVSVIIHTENATVARKYFTLLKKTYNINTDIAIRRSTNLNRRRIYVLSVNDNVTARNILTACKIMKPFGVIEEDCVLTDNQLIRKDCCKRAFIRGAFLAAGSVSDPVKGYHFEIVCTNEVKAIMLQSVISSFNMNAKVVRRKKYYVVYIKEGSQVVDLLNIMGAYNSLMNMENVRIMKDMRNNVNRQVNCETANINKTVSAAIKQIEDIHFLEQTGKYEELPETLREIAELRMQNPEASLLELGKLLQTPVGKSGVNHRLKKISSIADELRSEM